MPDFHTLPLAAPTGLLPALVLLFAFCIGHAFADFPLQGDFLSRGKNRNSPPPPLRTSFAADQWMHLTTKAVYVGVLWSGLLPLGAA